MKTVKQILEQYNTLETKQSLYDKSLVDLSSIGLLDESKIPLVDKAIKIDAALLSEAEKKALVELLQNTAKYFLYEAVETKNNNKKDPKKLDMDTKKDDKDFNPPMVLYFQRQSIRMFPNEVMVAMYFSKQLNKYISVPFGKNSVEYIPTKLDELYSLMRHRAASPRRSLRGGAANNTNDSSNNAEDEKPLPWPLNKAKDELDKLHPDVGNSFAKRKNQEISGMRRKSAMDQLAHSELAKLGGKGIKHAFSKAFDPNIHGPASQRPLGLIGAAARGTLAAGSVAARALANKIKERRGNKSQEQPVEEAFSFRKAPARRFKKPSNSEIWGKRTSEPKEPKEPVSAPKAQPKQKTVKPKSFYDHVDLEHHYKKLATAARDVGAHETIETWQKGKKVNISRKEYYANAANETARKIRERGGSVPKIGDKKPGSTISPNAIKPPVQAESFRRNLDRIREDRMDENAITNFAGSVVSKAKQLISGTGKPKNRTKSGSTIGSSDKYTDRSQKSGLGPIERRPSDTMSTSAAAQARRQGLGAANIAEALTEMIDKQIPKMEISIGDSSVTINNRLARKVMSVYESLNRSNKKKLEKMLTEDANSFRKAINFVVKA